MTTSSSAESKGGYDPAHFANLVEVEDRHFWFRARNSVIGTLLRQLISDLAPGYRVLEIGCGDGNVLRFLEQSAADGLVVGMDLYHEGLVYARRRCRCSLVQGDINLCPFSTLFDILCVFDVLEHLPDDCGALNQMHHVIAPGGALLITVPAHLSLWSDFDEASGHCRRYELDELRAKLSACGYQVEYLTPYMAVLHPLIWLSRKARLRSKMTSNEAVVNSELHVVPVVNGFLGALLSCENAWIARKKHLPFGASLLAVARKAP